jgi:hypothetical protein
MRLIYAACAAHAAYAALEDFRSSCARFRKKAPSEKREAVMARAFIAACQYSVLSSISSLRVSAKSIGLAKY